MRFRVLGPLEVRAGVGEAQAHVLTPRAAKIRVVLATLLMRAGDVVSVDALIDELWDEAPPRTATTTLQVYISQLRKMLHEADPEHGREALLTRPPGYVLRVDPGDLDLSVFERSQALAHEAVERRDHAAVADIQRRALALWRGPLLSDTPHGALLAGMDVRLTEARTAALEQRMRADLRLGRHRVLIGELQSVVAEFPMREEFHAHLMVALYRSGRQADALRVFAGLRRTLADELAVEPGRPVRELHGRILAGDPGLLRPATPAGPVRATGAPAPGPGGTSGPAGLSTQPPLRLPSAARLPSPDGLFTGRRAVLDELTALVRSAAPGGRVGVTGPAGVGKTALALAAARHLAADFPEGRVVVPLDSYGAEAHAEPAGPAQALTVLLRQCGATGPLPGSVGELTALLRPLFAGRRMLLIVDGAVSTAQAGALLTAAPDCVALVTGRRIQAGLGGPVIPLGVLSPADARDLLAAVSGRRHSDDVRSQHEITELCGHLPSAVRAAGALLAARPHRTEEELAARFADERTRLSELSAGDPSCHAELRAVYQAATEADRLTFRLLGTLPAGPFGPARAAAVLGTGRQAAERALDSLVDAGLLDAERAPVAGVGPYRFHGLFRLLAAERLAREEPADVARLAVAGLCEALADEAETAHRAARPRPPEWFAQRRRTLVEAVTKAHEAGLWRHAVRLTESMSGFVETLAAWDIWEQSHLPALDGARRLADHAAEARLLRSLGDLAWQRRRLPEAADHYRGALRAAPAGAAGDQERSRALVGLADLSLDGGAVREAAELVTLALNETSGGPRGRWEAERLLALLTLETEGEAAALRHFEECRVLALALGDRRLESYAQRWLRQLGMDAVRRDRAEVRPGVWRMRASTGVGAVTGAAGR